MKIAKALKLKNRLAGEVSRLKQLVVQHNSREASQESYYDVVDIVKNQLPKRIDELVLVKTVIACSNAVQHFINPEFYQDTPYWKIFKIAELKGLIETFRMTSTKSGSFNEPSNAYGASAPVITIYSAFFNQLEMDNLVVAAEKEIDNLQDELDVANATADVVLLDTISI